MDARFSITVDRRRALVTIVLSGLFQPADVAAFFTARRKAHARLSCPPGRHATLTDLRALKILPQETIDAFTTLLTDPESRARRLAFLVAPTLVRSQLMRVLAGREGRVFEDVAEAEAWLVEEENGVPPAQPSRRAPREAAPIRAAA